MMKVRMLKDILSICSPLGEIEELIRSREKFWSWPVLKGYVERHLDLNERMEERRQLALRDSLFVKVYPAKGSEAAEYRSVMNVVGQMPSDVTDCDQLPRLVDYFPPQQYSSRQGMVVNGVKAMEGRKSAVVKLRR
jgi:hypothetical protein